MEPLGAGWLAEPGRSAGGFHQRAAFGIERGGIALGGLTHAVGAEKPIARKRDAVGTFADYFRDFAFADAAQDVHLPEAILRGDVALRHHHVLDRTGGDVRHAPGIAIHADLRHEAGERRGPIELRERAMTNPPGVGSGADEGKERCGQQSEENCARLANGSGLRERGV